MDSKRPMIVTSGEGKQLVPMVAPGDERGVSVCCQMALSAACFGQELMMTFLSIYGILSLQYLGVPVSMVTVHGLICSAVSLLVIPLIGKLTDHGGNIRVRKAFSLIVGLGFILTAFSFIFAACALKISSDAVNVTAMPEQCAAGEACTSPQVVIEEPHLFEGLILDEDDTLPRSNQSIVKNYSFTSMNSSNQNNQQDSAPGLLSLPAQALLAILGLASLDIGFDVSLAPSRAFVLESVPTWQHRSVLALATVTASVAGVFLATVGLSEVPLRLASLLTSADQMAVALMILCVFIGVVNILSFALSLLTGFNFIKKREPASDSMTYKLPSSSESESHQHSEYEEIPPEEKYSGGDIDGYSNDTKLVTPDQSESSTPPTGKSPSTSFTDIFNKRLAVLLVACFFSYGAMIGFVTFASNSLTIEVYRGEPGAPPGTEARGNYQAGLRMSAVGVLVYYVMYFVVSAASKRILEMAGPRVFFISANLLMTLTCLLFTLTGHLVTYFSAMVACSLHKCMSYTVPFLLATEYSQPGGGKTSPGAHSGGLGRVTSLVGFLLPAQNLVISSSMGPLMAVTSSSWPPMYYVTVVSALAAVVMGASYTVKPKTPANMRPPPQIVITPACD